MGLPLVESQEAPHREAKTNTKDVRMQAVRALQKKLLPVDSLRYNLLATLLPIGSSRNATSSQTRANETTMHNFSTDKEARDPTAQYSLSSFHNKKIHAERKHSEEVSDSQEHDDSRKKNAGDKKLNQRVCSAEAPLAKSDESEIETLKGSSEILVSGDGGSSILVGSGALDSIVCTEDFPPKDPLGWLNLDSHMLLPTRTQSVYSAPGDMNNDLNRISIISEENEMLNKSVEAIPTKRTFSEIKRKQARTKMHRQKKKSRSKKRKRTVQNKSTMTQKAAVKSRSNVRLHDSLKQQTVVKSSTLKMLVKSVGGGQFANIQSQFMKNVHSKSSMLPDIAESNPSNGNRPDSAPILQRTGQGSIFKMSSLHDADDRKINSLSKELHDFSLSSSSIGAVPPLHGKSLKRYSTLKYSPGSPKCLKANGERQYLNRASSRSQN